MANVDWGDEVKPRPHSGRLGMDRILKDDARRDLQAVQGHLTRDPSLLLAKSGGHNRTFLWEATRGNHPDLVKHLLRMGADPNIPGRIRSECVVLLKPYCLARRYRHPQLAVLLLNSGTVEDIYSACFLGDTNRVRELLADDPALLGTGAGGRHRLARDAAPLCGGGRPRRPRPAAHRRRCAVRPYTRLLCDAAVRLAKCRVA